MVTAGPYELRKIDLTGIPLGNHVASFDNFASLYLSYHSSWSFSCYVMKALVSGLKHCSEKPLLESVIVSGIIIILITTIIPNNSLLIIIIQIIIK